jgi:hypothetical protein
MLGINYQFGRPDLEDALWRYRMAPELSGWRLMGAVSVRLTWTVDVDQGSVAGLSRVEKPDWL